MPSGPGATGKDLTVYRGVALEFIKAMARARTRARERARVHQVHLVLGSSADIVEPAAHRVHEDMSSAGPYNEGDSAEPQALCRA
jgi:hypothetical protein